MSNGSRFTGFIVPFVDVVVTLYRDLLWTPALEENSTMKTDVLSAAVRQRWTAGG